MKNEMGSNAWRWWGAIALVILLILLWLFGFGPKNSCCVDTSMASAPPVAVTETPILADYKDGKLTLTGAVGSADFKQGLLDAAAKAVGAENVIDALTVKADAKENDLLLTGIVQTQADDKRILDAFKSTIGLESIENKIIIAAPATMPVTAITVVLYKKICCTFQSVAPNAFKIPVMRVLSRTKMIKQVIRLTMATTIMIPSNIFFIFPCRLSQSKILG